MNSLGFEYIKTEMKFKIEVEYKGTGTVYVTAHSEEEARDMVESGEFDVEFNGDFDDSDFSNWNMQIEILDIQDSYN
jgi:DNA-dependent RNA polymerase auxiliary subunit epsilon